MSEPTRQVYEFDNFDLDVGERQLRRDGEVVALSSKAFDLLVALVENSGRLLGKEELYRRVWADQVVEESNLTVQISAIRKALGERRDNPRYIITVAGHGYRFVGEVGCRDEIHEVVIETRTRSHIVFEEVAEEDTGDNQVNPLPSSLQLADDSRTPISQAQSSFAPQTQSRILSVGHLARRRLLALGAVALLAGLMLLSYLLWSRQAVPDSHLTPPAPIKTIAVLPFKPLIAESRDEVLEMGMADTLIARLSNIREITVRPISAMRKYAGLEQDALAAGREQRVDAVLDGQIQKSGDRIRVTVRLLSVGDGSTLWAATFDDRITDIFTVEDSISERVVTILAVRLTGEERALVAAHSTNDADAYQLYLKGLFFRSKSTGEAIKKSIDYLNQAIEKDPNYALAYAGLANSYHLLSNYNVTTPHEAYSMARKAATEALQRNDKLAEAHSALASIMSAYDWDFEGAEREYRRAIELNPNLAAAHFGYGSHLGQMGRSTEAIAEMRRAQEIEPLSLSGNTDMGSVLYFAGRVDEAIDQLRKTIDLDSHYGRAHIELGYAYRLKRQYAEAISEFKKALEIDLEDSYALSQLAHTYGLMGQRDKAYRAIEQLKGLAKRQYVLPSDVAACYAGLDDKDQAFEWLEKAYTARDDGVHFLKVDPSWDPLRSDPRFADLLRRIGLPQ